MRIVGTDPENLTQTTTECTSPGGKAQLGGVTGGSFDRGYYQREGSLTPGRGGDGHDQGVGINHGEEKESRLSHHGDEGTFSEKKERMVV